MAAVGDEPMCVQSMAAWAAAAARCGGEARAFEWPHGAHFAADQRHAQPACRPLTAEAAGQLRRPSESRPAREQGGGGGGEGPAAGR
eukprot:2546304-Prymnesium_polylepis.1